MPEGHEGAGRPYHFKGVRKVLGFRVPFMLSVPSCRLSGSWLSDWHALPSLRSARLLTCKCRPSRALGLTNDSK